MKELPPTLRRAGNMSVRGIVSMAIAAELRAHLDTTGLRNHAGETREEIIARLAVDQADALIAEVVRRNQADAATAGITPDNAEAVEW